MGNGAGHTHGYARDDDEGAGEEEQLRPQYRVRHEVDTSALAALEQAAAAAHVGTACVGGSAVAELNRAALAAGVAGVAAPAAASSMRVQQQQHARQDQEFSLRL